MKVVWRLMTGVALALAALECTPTILAASAPVPRALAAIELPQSLAGDLRGVAQVSAGGAHTCAVMLNGGVKCWGDNRSGQLGDGTTRSRSAPVAVLGLTEKVVMISAGGAHTCAVTAIGGVKCWGHNGSGQLGDGTTVNRSMPVDVVGLTGSVQAITAGIRYTCALMTNGDVQCWGNNDLGQLGDGTTSARLTPVTVIGLADSVQSLDAGQQHTCALVHDGSVKCWGDNGHGELGDGTTVTRLTPVAVVGLPGDMQAVSAGDAFSCALTVAGGVKCWGAGTSGQLGNGRFIERQLTPVDVVDLLPGVKALSAGDAHTCVIQADDAASCWGLNYTGQVGAGSPASNIWRPTGVVGLTNAVMGIAANSLHTCALLADGDVKCWGRNDYGQLGDGTTITRRAPVAVWDTTYDCTTVTEIPELECRALVTFFHATNGTLWQSHTGWLQTLSPCSWQGAACTAGHVSALVLPANNLVDALPAALGDLAGLERLDLHGNDLEGPLPVTLGNLTALQYLDLSEIGLAGETIPPELGNLTALQYLDLHGNALNKQIPPQLAALTALQTFDLSENILTGPLPAGLSDLAQLRTLDLHDNQFAGPLPADLGRLVALQTLDLSANALTGTLPESLGEAAALRTLDLSANQLGGPLPWTWSRLTALERLDLRHNALSGELPPEWSLLPALRYLDLSYNTLEGWLPPGYGQWAALTHLDLSFNALRGTLPAAWGNLSHIQALSLNNNHLAGSIPAAWGALGSAGPAAGSATVPSSSAWWSSLPPGVYLDLSCNRLSGTIPVEIVHIRGLQAVNLASNQLRGAVPPELLTLNAPHAYVEDNLLVDLHDGTQTVPPTNLRARLSAPDTAFLTWEPVLFGFESYEVSYATAPAGPYILHGQVPSSPDSYSVSGLLPGAPHFFRVRTFSPAHGSQSPGWGDLFEHAYYQQSNLWSDYTPLVCVNCALVPRAFLPLVGRGAGQ